MTCQITILLLGCQKVGTSNQCHENRTVPAGKLENRRTGPLTVSPSFDSSPRVLGVPAFTGSIPGVKFLSHIGYALKYMASNEPGLPTSQEASIENNSTSSYKGE
ncbi:hypothetical protein Lal_00022719 [Lupinus albus]|nr:hypothetical protein Lal_00022719 [Lupinus albus]